MFKVIAFSFAADRNICIAKIAEMINALREHGKCQIVATDFNASSADQQFAALREFMRGLEEEDDVFLFDETVPLPQLTENMPRINAVRIDISVRTVATSQQEITNLKNSYRSNGHENRMMIELLRMKWGDERFYKEFSTTAAEYQTWLAAKERKKILVRGPGGGR